MSRATVARISTRAIQANAARARELAPEARILACVKADAYGHGIETVACALDGAVTGFAVACLEEGLTLRKAGITAPVLMLEGPHARDEIAEAFAHRFTLCISDRHQLPWLEAAAPDQRPACWLKVDTGMHRLGVPAAETRAVFEHLRRLVGSSPVLCTHFANADSGTATTTATQLETFDRAVEGLDASHSCANSAAILAHPASHRQWVRPGYMLYGGNPMDHGTAAQHGLQASMELSAEIISIRDVPAGDGVGYGGRWRAGRPSRIATIAAGYGDGYPRHAPDGTPVRIGRYRSPLAGRVSMDMITVDVTDNPDARIGARAVLWGTDPRIDEVAGCADTIGYELLAGMPRRVPRRAAP